MQKCSSTQDGEMWVGVTLTHHRDQGYLHRKEAGACSLSQQYRGLPKAALSGNQSQIPITHPLIISTLQSILQEQSILTQYLNC